MERTRHVAYETFKWHWNDCTPIWVIQHTVIDKFDILIICTTIIMDVS